MLRASTGKLNLVLVTVAVRKRRIRKHTSNVRWQVCSVGFWLPLSYRDADYSGRSCGVTKVSAISPKAALAAHTSICRIRSSAQTCTVLVSRSKVGDHDARYMHHYIAAAYLGC
jgi:hypothetical protein